MTEYDNAELRSNLEIGQVLVSAAANNGLNVPITFANTRLNTSYKVKLTLYCNNTTATEALCYHLSAKSTTGMTAQVRKLSASNVTDTIGQVFIIFYEVWD